MKKHVSSIGFCAKAFFATLCGFWMTSVHVQAATHTLQYKHHIENISKDSAGYDMGDINDHLVEWIDGVLVGTVTNHHMYGYVFAQTYGVSAYWNVDVYNADGTSSRTSWTSSSSPYTTSPAPSYVGQWNWNRYQSVSGGGHNSHLTTVKLKTFGASGSTTDNIYKVTASAFTEAGASIPYWAISVGGRALNSSGEAFLALADHSERDITPSVSGYSNYYFSIGATQIKPMIKWGGTDITGSTVSTVVGLRPTLTLDTTAPVPITSYAWSVAGQRVANFVATSTNGGPVPLTILTNSTVTFAWTDRGTGLDVSCTINVAGETATAKTKFNVFKPTSSVQTTEDDVWMLGNSLSFGNTGVHGIQFYGTITDAGGYTGSVYFG
jgi:hypothetical protein